MSTTKAEWGGTMRFTKSNVTPHSANDWPRLLPILTVRRQYIPAGCHGNAAMIVETHHADFDVLVKVGGNRGVVVKEKG